MKASLDLHIQVISRAGLLLAAVLGSLTVLAWVAVAGANMPLAGTIDPVTFGLFLAIWAVGMVAMMFPSLVPMVYAMRVSARKSMGEIETPAGLQRLRVHLQSTLFILGYVAVWALVGGAFNVAIAILSRVKLPISLGSVGIWGGLILIGTGLYQFSRFKQRALMKCRSPMGFILSRWKNGNVGAGVMGADYGWFCTGCCWVLMLGLLTVGNMSMPLMGIFSMIIFAEKVAPFGEAISKLVGASFVTFGLILLV